MELRSACEASNFKRRNWLHKKKKSRIPFRTHLEGSLNRYDWCCFALLTEVQIILGKYNWNQSSPALWGPSFSGLHLLLTPERQTSDWPRYISDQIPLRETQECVTLIVQNSGESIPSATFLPCLWQSLLAQVQSSKGSRSSCWCHPQALGFQS